MASTTPAKSESLFPSSKKDKRRIKHAQLVNKVTKSAKRNPRRRRPNKQLVTTLDALADALPDDGNAAAGAVAGERSQDQVNIIKRKSMKSRPGAMKRRENLDKGERDRFAKNMAQLAAPKSDPEASQQENPQDGDSRSKTAAISSTSERWAALRGFISQTLETKPELRDLKA
jgi:hypothetical protein